MQRGLTRVIVLVVVGAIATFATQGAYAAAAGAAAFASAGSSSGAGGGTNTWTSDGSGPGNAAGPMNFGGFLFPDAFGPLGIHNALRMHMQQMQELLAQHQQMTFSNGVGDGLSSVGGGGDGTADSAHASLNLDNRGGNAEAYLVPDVNLMSRISESLPPASGGPIAVFSSSSSGSHVDADGKTQSFKHASVGVNDNGKVRVFTVKDP